jgi:hypothetical protein
MLLDGDENEQNFFMFLHSACQTNNCLFEIRWRANKKLRRAQNNEGRHDQLDLLSVATPLDEY